MSVPAVNGGYDLTSIGLRLRDPDLPLEDFSQLCWVLGRFHEAVRFAIGDALIKGEELYGEEAFQAFEELNLSVDARFEYRRVSQKVPFSRRRKGLSWSHHRAVAALDPPEQKEWLKRAVNESMSHHELRDALRGSGASPLASPARCECCKRLL